MINTHTWSKQKINCLTTGMEMEQVHTLQKRTFICLTGVQLKTVIMIIIVALKGAYWYFLQSPHCAANSLQRLWSSGHGTTVCKSCATHPVLIMCNMSCHMVWRDSSAIKFDRVEIAFILVLLHWWKQFTDEGGEETRVPRETLMMSFRKCPSLKPENASPNQDPNPHSSTGGRLGKQTC